MPTITTTSGRLPSLILLLVGLLAPLAAASSVTAVTLDGTPAAKLTTAAAGRTLTAVGGNSSKPIIGYLYGPGRPTPEAADLHGSLKLPTPLPAGIYALKIRRQGDTDYTVLTLTVTPAHVLTPATPATVPATAPAAITITAPIHPADGTTLDGHGQTIVARKLACVFDLTGTTGVTVRNYVVDADAKTNLANVVNAKSATLDTIAVAPGSTCNTVAKVIGSAGVTLTDLHADTIEDYLVYSEDTDGLTITRPVLTVGSRSETGIRLYHGVTHATIDTPAIAATLNKHTALRLHQVQHVTVTGGWVAGLVWAGPMSGDNGGERYGWVSDGHGGYRPMLPTDTFDCMGQPYNHALAIRREYLAWTASDITLSGVAVKGAIGLQAGLTGFVMDGGSISPPAESPFFGWATDNTTWSYPDRKFMLPGDPAPRCKPSGVLRNVVVTAPGRDTLNWGTNSPWQCEGVRLNGGRVG